MVLTYRFSILENYFRPARIFQNAGIYVRTSACPVGLAAGWLWYLWAYARSIIARTNKKYISSELSFKIFNFRT